MKVFIVYAHHEPRSFNALLRERAVASLTASGHEVRVSDLYAQGFDPVAGPRDLGAAAGEGPVNLLLGQREAAAGGPEALYHPDAPHAATLDQILWPITHGTLHFCGLDVLPTFVAWSVFQAGEAGRDGYLVQLEDRLRALEQTSPMPGHGHGG
jgi:putative NADPH-quinone reductase